MSRREDRDSNPRRRRSRFDGEPSPTPKKSRRDGKPATEKSEIGSRVDQGQKHHHRLQDPLPLEAPSAPKVKSRAIERETDKKANGDHLRTKHSSDASEVPRSRSYFQHDEHSRTGHNGRRTGSERGWWRDPRERKEEAAVTTEATENRRHRDNRSQVKEDDKWCHDGFYKMEADQLPSRKRRTFSEKKILAYSYKVVKEIPGHTKPRDFEQPLLGNGKREERGDVSHNSDRHEKPFARDRARKSEARRDSYPSRERYGGGGRGSSGGYRGGRDRFSGREEHHPRDPRAEKWEHDLFFRDANRSPTPKNEEQRIAKVEALLAS